MSAENWSVEALHIATMVIGGADVPVFAFLLRNGEQVVLVDAGTPEPEVVQQRWKTPCEYGGREPLRQELAARGLQPDDVDILVLSHLHFDHAGNIDLFPQANVMVHKQELVHAIDPVPSQRGAYSRMITPSVLARSRPRHLTLLRDQISTIAPGLDAVLITGHTPGTVGVVAATARGHVGLPSDAGDRYDYWFAVSGRGQRWTREVSVPHIRSEGERETVRAMAEFHERCDIVVPSHDWRIPQVIPSEWWETPDSQASGGVDA